MVNLSWRRLISLTMLGIGAKMIKKIFIVLGLSLFIGCAHSKIKENKHDRMIRVERAGISPSFCFDGLLWRMLRAGCKQVEYENVGIGHTRYWCAETNKEEKTESLFRSEDFFMIALNRRTGTYAVPVPPDTLPLCADSFGLLVTAPKD